MPRIRLKYKSPEFADEKQEGQSHGNCEMPGCPESGEHKAPKHRGLNEYYNFCFEHVKDYNKAWDFFSGMSDSEIADHVVKSHYGDRPTWKYSIHEEPVESLFRAAKKMYGDESDLDRANKNKEQEQRRFENAYDSTTPEHEALAIMGLSVPITIDEIKTRYKMLAKKYHPDLNKNDPECEELLKRVNMAYTILKLAFEEYKRLPDHKF